MKLLESQKFDISKKLTQLEEAYKRDMTLFRNETLKKDEEWEEEKLKYEQSLTR